MTGKQKTTTGERRGAPRRLICAVGLTVIVTLLGATPVASAVSVGARGVARARLARGAELVLSQAPAALRAAVRRTVGVRSGPLRSASPPTNLTAAGAGAFGASVAISGSTAVVGALGTKSGSGPGAAYVFVRSGSTWSRQAKLTAKGLAGTDFFGWSVGIYGSTVVVSAPAKNSRAGAAYVFARSGTTWKLQAKLTEPHAAAGDFFGGDLGIYKSTAVVDAPFTHSRRGAVYVFVRSGTTWKRQATITEPHAANNDAFGDSLALYGSTVLANSVNRSAAYVFVRSGGTWSRQAKLTEPAAANNATFGDLVAVYKSTAVVTAGGNTKTPGAAFVFVRSGGSWTRQGKLTASDGVVGVDQFGNSGVAVYGATVVVGASGKNPGGAAYVFARSGTTWTQQAEITDPNATAGDGFGLRVALDGSTALVGASGTKPGGAAYVFAGL